ncbi:hypothetical protein VST63_19175 [Mycolicibacterium sp. 050232]|uniref:hypothetical protein n=1 Tax=Mycolicibacterium sp. 050232 TaxID=3113982 RepID=UPI002E2D3E37|nr:hypothetical protein [Mycolicibacterium sp. 050232]MED5814484.1 hypothetical protein [Mycolicibacterium sp. 050232]
MFNDDQTPNDIVPRRDPTRAEILELDAVVGRQVAMTVPGGIVDGPDGQIIGLKEPTTYPAASLFAPCYPLSVLRAAGVDPAEVPNSFVVNDIDDD